MPNTGSWTTFQEVTTPIQRSSGVHNLYLVAKGGLGVANLDWLQFEDSTGTNTPTNPPTNPTTGPVSGQT